VSIYNGAFGRINTNAPKGRRYGFFGAVGLGAGVELGLDDECTSDASRG
jgi:hypothetical protein